MTAPRGVGLFEGKASAGVWAFRIVLMGLWWAMPIWGAVDALMR